MEQINNFLGEDEKIHLLSNENLLIKKLIIKKGKMTGFYILTNKRLIKKLNKRKIREDVIQFKNDENILWFKINIEYHLQLKFYILTNFRWIQQISIEEALDAIIPLIDLTYIQGTDFEYIVSLDLSKIEIITKFLYSKRKENYQINFFKKGSNLMLLEHCYFESFMHLIGNNEECKNLLGELSKLIPLKKIPEKKVDIYIKEI